MKSLIMERRCPTCKNKFDVWTSHPWTTFCSIKCAKRYKQQNKRKQNYRELIISYYEYTCQSCGNNNIDLHIHHKIPLEVGGKNHWSNVTVLCTLCHRLVHSKGVIL